MSTTHDLEAAPRPRRIFRPWRSLLRLARIHPRLVGGLVFGLLLVVSGAIGWFFEGRPASSNWQRLRDAADAAGIFLGFFSMALGWSLALLAWAHRKGVDIFFEHSGIDGNDVRGLFKASLILGSKNPQPAWHLCHIQPERADFVWTQVTREATIKLLKDYRSITSEFAPTDESDDSHMVNSPYDLTEVYNHCIARLRELLLTYRPQDLCVDVTASTGVMSIAAFQAAERLGVSSIYLVGHSEKYGNPVILETDVDKPKKAHVVILSDHRNDPPSE